ncbi:hypothetical protein RRSWK_03623 [Rhodopirellula sp. SWK7]|nr:hypothetical protein RRSWK_03623 [Rhodopirellula sp. SWK7]
MEPALPDTDKKNAVAMPSFSHGGSRFRQNNFIGIPRILKNFA